MIVDARPLPCGNAVSLTVTAGDDWSLLRRADDAFQDGGVVIATGPAGGYQAVLDYRGLSNGVPAWYLVLVDGEPSGDPVSVTPSYHPGPLLSLPDVTGLIRERLDLGLRAELAAGRLSHAAGAIPVVSATPLLDTVKLPVVTVILTSRSAAVRGIGELFDVTTALDEGLADVAEGWLDRSTIDITVWALNHEDRLRLRDAVQRVLMLNLPVFDAAGMITPDLSESDVADFESFSAPVYRSQFSFSCMHPALVRAQEPVITEVHVYASETPRR